MKKVFALLCGILLLCAACAPVTPETPEQSADTTTATTTTTAITTSFATTTTATATATYTTTTQTAATTVAVTTTAPTTATTRGQIIVDPIICWERIAYYEYVDWVRGMANDIEGLSQTLYRGKYSTHHNFVDYYHELWLTDRCVWLPVLPDGWYCELVRVVSGGRVFFYVFNEAGEEFTITCNTYRGDARDEGPHNNTNALKYWSTLNQEEAALENGYPVKALTLKDGTPCKFTEYFQYGAFGEVDGYMWRVHNGGFNSAHSSTSGVEDLVRNLSFEKIEL